jgi:hypothetical protein
MAPMPTERMGPPPGASPPMRMTASWSGPNLPNTSLRRAIRAQWRAPLRSSRRRIAGPSDAELSKKGPSPAHRPSACSGVKALRNTSLAKAASRQAPLAFRSLDPFRALREPDCRRVRTRLAAGGEWIRTFSSAPDGQRFRSFVRDRPDRP